MRLPHLPGLISMEQKGSVAAIVSPAEGMRSTDRARDSRRGKEGTRRPDRAQVTAAGGDNYVYFRVFAKCLHSAAYFLPAGRVKYRCRKGGGSDVGPVPGCTADKNKVRVKRCQKRDGLLRQRL